MLEKVKSALGITGAYQDGTISQYIDEVKHYLTDAGVPSELLNSDVSLGVIARGVSDLWNYGTGKLSDYFYQRASQLTYAVEVGRYIIFTAGDYGVSYPISIEGLDIAPDNSVVFKCGDIEKTYTDVHGNTIYISFTDAESAQLDVGTYKWTLKVVKATSAITVVNDGVLIVA